MDKVREIARAIAELKPAEKQRLFRLLGEQGELPVQSGLLMPIPAQPVAARAKTPDYVLIFDGGSKGNPGLGYGSYAVIRSKDSARRVERLEFGDGYTNNEAEYDTLIVGLRDLISRIEQAGRRPGEFSLEVRGDSALVINQLLGTWKVKEPRMRERRDECFRLLRQFGSVDLKTQPREESVRALGH